MFCKTANKVLAALHTKYDTANMANVSYICNYIDTNTVDKIVEGEHYDLMQLAVVKPQKVIARRSKLKILPQVLNTALLVKFLNSPGTFVLEATNEDFVALANHGVLRTILEGTDIKQGKLSKFMIQVSDLMFSNT